MKSKSLNNKKILITYGPTWVALDDMRVISNQSSGTMGKLIIDNLLKFDATVTALEGPITQPLKNKKITVKNFTFFDEFKKLFTQELKKKYDIVIHAAAVSDFKPQQQSRTKISSKKQLTINFIPTEKIIQSVKKLAPKSFLVGFKLESLRCPRHLKKEALTSVNQNKCDLVIANSFKNGYIGLIINKDGKILSRGKSRQTISNQLVKILAGHDY